MGRGSVKGVGSKGDGGSAGTARSVRWTSCRPSSRKLGRPGWCPAGWQRTVQGIGQGRCGGRFGVGWRPGSCGADINTPSYAEAVVLGRGSVGPRGGARRGSQATGPGVPPGRRSMMTPSGRGAVRGATVAQTPVQLAGAAAQRDAREAGQTREAVGGDWPGLHCGKSCTCTSAGEAEVAGM